MTKPMSEPRAIPVVLVVEDDPDIRDALAFGLELEGHHVVAVGEGSAALAWLERNAAPCLILLDLYMPVMSGEEFRKVQRSDPRFSSVPVIVISAANDAREKAHALGAVDWLQKPLRLDALCDLVARHC